MTEEAWQRMLLGEPSEEEGSALITATMAELNELLEHIPTARNTSIRILDARLKDPLLASSWEGLMESLGAFLGSGPAYLLSWIAYGDWEERMSKVSAAAAPEAVRFIRELTGIYGSDIRRAMIVRDQLPGDWVGLRLIVLENQLLEGDYRVSVELDKVMGETVALEGPPDSILNLVRHLLVGLNAVRNSAAFSQDRIDAFREQVGSLEKLLSTDRPSETAEDAEDAKDIVATAEASTGTTA
jgi:hypothetical protein